MKRCKRSCWRSVWATQCSRSIDRCRDCTKKREQSWDIYHEGCQECIRSSCDEGARYPVQWLGEKILHRSVHRVDSYGHVLSTTVVSFNFIALLPYESISTKSSQITVRYFRLCDVISSHMTTLSSEVQVCCSSNAPKARVFWPSQALWGTSSLMTSLRVMWGYFRSRDVIPVKWLVFPASYCLECVEMHQKSVYLYCPKPCDVTPCLIRSLLGDFRSLPITCHFGSCD